MRLLVDASVLITLAETDAVHLLEGLDGDVVVPRLVAEEIRDDPARTELENARGDWLDVVSGDGEDVRGAMSRLGGEGEPRGDAALLALALAYDEAVVVTDDRPLRNTCKALGVPLSGSLGVVVASVEEGHLAPQDAKDLLVAMDKVGGRFSASLLRKAESLIDRAY